jgi:hypothetical protein
MHGYMGMGSPDHADALIWALTDLMPGWNDVPVVMPYIATRPRYDPFA